MKNDSRCAHAGDCARCPLARSRTANAPVLSPVPASRACPLAALRSRLQLSPIACAMPALRRAA